MIAKLRDMWARSEPEDREVARLGIMMILVMWFGMIIPLALMAAFGLIK